MVDPKRPIRRSTTDRVLGGVLAGMADWLGCDASVARAVYILVTAFTGFALGIVAYAALWIFLPAASPREVVSAATQHPASS